MSTKYVAAGYGVGERTIRAHKERHQEEFIEGVHYLVFTKGITRGTKSSAGSLSSTYVMWTKQGVIRLGFFIKSEQARLFRDWAEHLILFVAENKQAPREILGVLTRREKREIARRLYQAGLTKTRISEVLGVSKKSISKWNKEVLNSNEGISIAMDSYDESIRERFIEQILEVQPKSARKELYNIYKELFE